MNLLQLYVTEIKSTDIAILLYALREFGIFTINVVPRKNDFFYTRAFYNDDALLTTCDFQRTYKLFAIDTNIYIYIYVRYRLDCHKHSKKKKTVQIQTQIRFITFLYYSDKNSQV